jgi:galactokinase
MTTASDPRTTDAAAIEPDALRRALASRVPDAASSPDVRIVRAPGRANLIGEHTDYNQGLVLPAAIDLEIRMAVLPTDDRRVEVTLLATGERTEFSLDDLPPDHHEWPAYVAGVAWSLTAAGIPIRGFRAVLASTLPVSAGLSSSAALELASAWALLDPPSLEAVGIDGMKLAQLAQRAENEYVGVRSGLMDQFASSLGRRGAAMLLDCRSLEYRPVRIPLAEHGVAAAPRVVGVQRATRAVRGGGRGHRGERSRREVAPRRRPPQARGRCGPARRGDGPAVRACHSRE